MQNSKIDILKGDSFYVGTKMARQFQVSQIMLGQSLPLPPSYINEQKTIKYDIQSLKQFYKSLKQTKIGEQRSITPTTQITNVINITFLILKQILKSTQKQQSFEQFFKIYIDLLRSKQNCRNFLTQVQQHLKQLIGTQFFKYKRNKRLYIYMYKLFQHCSYTVYKVLINRNEIFQYQIPQVIEVYKEFIKFAAQKKNNNLLLTYIQTQIANENTSNEKLSILLTYYKQKLPIQLIQKIEQKIDIKIQLMRKHWKQQSAVQRLISLINQFLLIQWPLQSKKYRTIIKYINMWKQPSHKQQKIINNFLRNMPCLYLPQNKTTYDEVQNVLRNYISEKFLMINNRIEKNNTSLSNLDFNQTFVFISIIIEKIGKNLLESYVQKDQLKKTIENLLKESFPLKQGLIGLLSTLKKNNIHDLGMQSQQLLIDKIKALLSIQKNSQVNCYSQINRQQLFKVQENILKKTKTSQDLIYCIKALRYYNFNHDAFWNIYSMIKRYVFKKKIISSYDSQFRKQVVKACLYIISKISSPPQCRNILSDIIDIIGQDQPLKILYIQWSSEYEQFYRKKLFQVYNTQQYLEILIHDYSSKNIVMKRFSIKVLCLLYPYSQCQIIPFLKKTYYQIYQRLSVKDLVEPNQKRIGLKLIRQIIRHRPEIVQDDAVEFSAFLYVQLCAVVKYNYNVTSGYMMPQKDQLAVQVLKTLISLMKRMTKAIFPYVKSIGHHIVQLLNSKITSAQIKKIALQTFNQMVFNCGYVIIPYFYYKDLLFIFRQILKSDDQNTIYRNQLMKLIGSLGYVSRQKFTKLTKLIQNHHQLKQKSSNPKYLEFHFQKTFKQINYLKQTKSLLQIKETSQLFAKSPYFSSDQKINKTYIQNFNYKQFIIQKVLKSMNPQSSCIIFYNTFKTLQIFVFILHKSDENKMYQKLVFDKILSVDEQNLKQTNKSNFITGLSFDIFPPSHMISLLVKIILNQQFREHANIVFLYFCKFIFHRKQTDKLTLILDSMFKISQKYPEMINIDMKFFLLSIRQLTLELHHCKSKNNKIDIKTTDFTLISQQIRLCFGIINNLSKQVDNYLHLFLPDFNDLFLRKPQQICETYFSLLFNLFKHAPTVQQFLPQISEHLLNLLKSQLKDFKSITNKNKSDNACLQDVVLISTHSFIQKIINFLISLILMYGDKFKPLLQSFHILIKQHEVHHVFYSILQQFMKKNSCLLSVHYCFTHQQLNEILKFESLTINCQYQQSSFANNYKHESVLTFKTINQMIEMFNCDQNQIEEQSEEWFYNLSIMMFQKSQEPFIRACSALVKEDKTLSNDLFQLAFFFFWNILANQFRKRLTMKIKNILENKVISLRVKQKFIDAVYFMQQCRFPIQLTDKLLCQASSDVLDSAKSLFYTQKLFYYDPQVHGQSLIKMYAQMGETQSAVGLLSIVQNLNTKTKIVLYQKLNRYREALRQHENLKDKAKFQNIQLQIKIRKNMFEWESVLNKCQKLDKYKSKLSHLAVQAAINLGKWDQVKKNLPFVDHNHQKSNLWKAMLNIYDKKYDQVQKYIKMDRQLVYPKVCQLFNFSYERKMQGIIRLQTLTQLQQANQYLKLQKNQFSNEGERKPKSTILSKKKLIQTLWNDRIQGVNTNLWSMQQLLLGRSLLFSKSQDIDNWINYCKLALKQNQPQLCKKTIQTLAIQLKDQKKKFYIQTLLVQCKFTLGQLKDQEAVNQIQRIIDQKLTSGSHHQYYYKCALWLSAKQFDFTVEKAKKSISLLNIAVKSFKTYIKGWHLLGLMHNKVLQLYQISKKNKLDKRVSNFLSSSKQFQDADVSNVKPKQKQKDKENDSKQLKQKDQDSREYHVFQALKSFIKSVSCGVKNHQFFLEDCLKIMNIIFTEHQVEGLLQQLKNTYLQIPSDGLIQIIPQIVGRLDISDKPLLLNIMKKFLIHIGSNHPQAIIFPIIFCKKCDNPTKKQAAQQILKQISKNQNNKIVQIAQNAQKITQQLCRVSLKLNQRFYIFVQKVLQKSKGKGKTSQKIAINYLKLIKQILQQDFAQVSISEFGFIQQYRQDFKDICKKLEMYLDTKQTQLFKKAQRKIIIILNQTKQSLLNTNKIFLQQVAPVLYGIHNSKVCLFGSYNPNAEQIYIDGFKNQLTVVSSKQRPKKVVITGSNGKNYNYLLKGKEDLRLDQRIMQLFSLINKMFHDPSQRQNYSIMGYSITPISLQIGIISWVENCDTIGEIIKKERSSAKVFLQKQISKQLCKYYQILPTAQKVQIYKQIETQVSGTDLRNVFWTRSSTSQDWLKSRTTFTRSLAVMSIVGYIIGLGDRHPNNIMIQRDTGQIIHIDFGDCFDVNKMRKQYPQRVPFRLTRMLVKAMQPCGVHGIFKHTCQKIIKLLRSNKQSIIAIVEAFRYDPLIGWRLVKDQNQEEGKGKLQHSYDENDVSFIKPEDKKTQRQNKNIDFAQHILNQIKKKLNGKLFQDSNKIMSPEEQVSKLIQQAMSPQNLVQHYQGWQIYW